MRLEYQKRKARRPVAPQHDRKLADGRVFNFPYLGDELFFQAGDGSYAARDRTAWGSLTYLPNVPTDLCSGQMNSSGPPLPSTPRLP